MKASFLKGLINFFNDPLTFFYGWKIIGFIKENTLFSIFICGAAILAVVIFIYIIEYFLNRFKL